MHVDACADALSDAGSIPAASTNFKFGPMAVTVYILKGERGKRYVGITNDLDRRLSEHRAGKTKGGQVIGTFTLLHTERFPDYGSARKREKYLKSGCGRAWLDDLETGRTRSAEGG